MSLTITKAFVEQYRANVMLLYQQRGPKLRGTTRMETVVGKNHFFERLASTAAVKRTTRHGDTPLVDQTHDRRRVSMNDFEWADLVDDVDKIRLLITPESAYAINAAMALGRTYDDEIIDAFDADATDGDGAAVTFASDNSGDRDLTAAAVKTGDIMDTKTDMDNKDIPTENRWLVVSPEFMNQILVNATAPEAASSDYNTIRAIVRGELNSWVGFQWIMSTRLPDSTDPLLAANERFCFAWHIESMGIAMGKDISARISERGDKSYSTQVYASLTMGATRIQNGVVRLKILETN